jgi:hypothetical protein
MLGATPTLLGHIQSQRFFYSTSIHVILQFLRVSVSTDLYNILVRGQVSSSGDRSYLLKIPAFAPAIFNR